MLSDEAKRSASPAKFSQHTSRKAAVADMCTLAPWDELAAFREETRCKFEEMYAMLQERREGETRLERQYQQTDAKVERFARQTRGLHSRTEIFESHLSGQAKELDMCREAHEGLRDKVQRSTQDWTSNFEAFRADLDEALEQRHEAVLEASRRGSRSVAEELLKKMGELNEKLGANMLSLEEEVVVELKQIKSDLEVQDKRLLEGLRDGRSSVDQMCTRLDDKLEKFQSEFSELSEGLATTSEQAQNQSSRLIEYDTKVAKINESLSRLESRTIATEQATSSKLEQLKDELDEAVDQNSSSLVRIRSDLDSAARDMARTLREEMREEMRSTRDDSCKDLQSAREEFRASLAQGRELAQSFQTEATMGLADVKGDLRTLCRDVYRMIADVQQQTNTAQTDFRTQQDATQQDVDARLEELCTKVAAMNNEVQDATRSSSCANAQLLTLTETLGGTQLRLAELASSTGRIQTSIDEICAVAAKQASFTETRLADVRRELRAEAALTVERQEDSFKHQIGDLRGDWQHQFEMFRGETGERLPTFQKHVEDLAHRQRSIETQVVEMHEHLQDRLRDQARDNAKQQTECQAVIEEGLQNFIRQNDANIASLRNEVAKVASVSRESRSEIERTCQRRLEEVTHNQESRFSEALSSCKDGCNEKISAAISELRCEMQSVRASIAEQAIASVGRAEQLASEIQKQTDVRGDEMKRELEELESKVQERLGNLASTARQNLQETRQETRQHIIRQLDERLRPLFEKLTETAGECKSARRSENDLGNRCDRLQQCCAELGVTQQSLVQQLSSTNQELSELRVELRGQMQFWHREGTMTSRDRSIDGRLLVRDDLLNEEPQRAASMFEAVDEQAKSTGNQSQDRWVRTGCSQDFQRTKPRATFDMVLAASPLRARSTSPVPASGGRLEENWTFGSRTDAFQKHADAFPRKRTMLVGPRATPLRSPRSLCTSYA